MTPYFTFPVYVAVLIVVNEPVYLLPPLRFPAHFGQYAYGFLLIRLSFRDC